MDHSGESQREREMYVRMRDILVLAVLANVIAIVAKYHGGVVDRIIVRRVSLIDWRYNDHVVLLGHLQRRAIDEVVCI
jgi:hypothetical protein